MEKLNTQVDLYLSEVSLELLGNKMYDINGKRQHKLMELFKAVPESKKQILEDKHENSVDFMCSLGYEKGFTEDSQSLQNYLEEQTDYTLVDANNSEKVNDSIIEFLRNYKSDQDKLIKDVSEVHVKKLIGNVKSSYFKNFY